MSEAIERNGYVLFWLGGNCPVQAEGLIDGHSLYFRARGSQWSLTIGNDGGREPPLFGYIENWGTWPDAGYMSDVTALSMIDKAVTRYREERPKRIGRDDARWTPHVLRAWSEGRFGTVQAKECLGVDDDQLEALAASLEFAISPYHRAYKEAVALLAKDATATEVHSSQVPR